MNDTPVIDAGGQPRALACLPGPVGAPGGWAADPRRTLPPAQWRPADLPALFPEVGTDDQGRTLSCVGHAVETVFSYAWLLAGRAFKEFSPTFVYALANHDEDRGADIGTAVRALALYGLAEASYVPEGVIFRSQFPAGAIQNARLHRPVDPFRVASFDAACTALSLGQPLATGILVGRDFSRLDAEGVPPVAAEPVGGHAVALVGLSYSEARKDWLLLAQNSYGRGWGVPHPVTGVGGFCRLSRDHFKSVFFDTWGLGGVLAAADFPAAADPPPPPR